MMKNKNYLYLVLLFSFILFFAIYPIAHKYAGTFFPITGQVEYIDTYPKFHMPKMTVGFADVTNQVGVDIKSKNFGVAWGDYDQDGYDDIFISNRKNTSKLLRNIGNGTFRDVTNYVGIKNHTAYSATFADIDNDGYLDLVIIGKDKPILYKNEKGKFHDITRGSGIENATGQRKGTASFGDIDNDGYLDLVISYNGKPNSAIGSYLDNMSFSDLVAQRIDFTNPVIGHLYLFKNVRDGIFLDMSNSIPELSINEFRRFYQPIFFDYNNDNLIDIFIAIDTDYPVLLKNKGDFIFSYVSNLTNIYDKRSWMGASAGDYDNDGDFDLYVTAIRGDILYQNLGNNTFSIKNRLNRESVAWGTIFIDYDNDGLEDIFVCNGDTGQSLNLSKWLQDYPLTRKNQLYKNIGNDFLTVTDKHIYSDNQSCVGTATADFDNNGFPDIFVANRADVTKGDGSKLYKNIGNSNSLLKIKLVGRASNRFGVGAKIQVTNGILTQTKLVTAGNSFFSQSSFEKIFGFGSYKGRVDITVYWPSGIVQQLNNIKLNKRIIITEKLISS